ncbi:MAG: VWA domain-containing protein [Chloroflexi bacterium]|nr:VWA domain-containing protein [Chloroflexota bacterium]
MVFEWPYVLLGLALLPLLLLAYVVAQRRRRTYAVRFTNLELLSHVVGRMPGMRRHIPPLLFLVGLAALLVSLARPVAVLALPRERSTVMLVIDVSGSMSADDLVPDRMAAAKQAARTFIEKLPPHVGVGLVMFNDKASLNAPIMRDHEAVLRAVDSLRPGGGTAIGDGLAAALDNLAQQPAGEDGQPPPSSVVLLSDGESRMGADPEEVAQRAAAEGVLVNTVGIGQRGVLTKLGGNQSTSLDEDALRAVSETAGGQYFYAAETNELESIYSTLSSQVSWIEERTEITALVAAVSALALLIGGLLSLRWFQQFP